MIRILLVEDEPASGEYLQSIVEKYLPSAQVVGMAENGVEALEMLETQECDIVISDICMPRMDGLELAREIQEKWPGLYTIIVSGYERFEYAKCAMQYGVSEYLLKPVKPVELVACVDRLAERISLKNRARQVLRAEGMQGTAAESAVQRALGDVTTFNMVKAHLEAIVKEGETRSAQEADSEVNREFKAVRDYLETHLSQTVSLGKVCRVLNMSQASLARLFRTCVDRTFVEYLTELRMEKAKKLMEQNPDCRLKEIAVQVGFSDALYFSRVFRQHTGYPPSEYAKQVRDK